MKIKKLSNLVFLCEFCNTKGSFGSLHSCYSKKYCGISQGVELCHICKDDIATLTALGICENESCATKLYKKVVNK
jgi:hypothetical protein